jgi:putative peptide-modifying radical SAM enzyme
MAVTEEMDIYPEVTWLLQLKDPKFDSVHWQIDFMFNDQALWKDIELWISQKYNPQISLLVAEWVANMKQESRVLKIYPFLGIMNTLLSGQPSHLPCGAGWIWQNICTDGIIAACPVGADFKPFHIGHIATTHPLETLNALHCGNPCPACEIFEVCGGRCLYANMFKPWGETGYSLVCKTVFHLVHELRKIKPEIEELITSGKLKLTDFDYFKYNCCEIIP